MKAVFILMSVVFFATACGEQFQGRFSGNLNATGCSSDANMQADMDVTINGNQIDLKIVRLDADSPVVREAFTNQRVVTGLSGNSSFNYASGADPSGADNGGQFFGMSGSITSSRTEINSFQATRKINNDCTYVLEGDTLFLSQ